MANTAKLLKEILAFREARDWKQFNNPKDMALSLCLEAAEVLEHFQWKPAVEVEKYVKTHRKEIGEEIVDVLYWVILIANDLDIDLEKAFMAKMRKNKKKYPAMKFKGKHPLKTRNGIKAK